MSAAVNPPPYTGLCPPRRTGAHAASPKTPKAFSGFKSAGSCRHAHKSFSTQSRCAPSDFSGGSTSPRPVPEASRWGFQRRLPGHTRTPAPIRPKLRQAPRQIFVRCRYRKTQTPPRQSRSRAHSAIFAAAPTACGAGAPEQKSTDSISFFKNCICPAPGSCIALRQDARHPLAPFSSQDV